MSVYRPRARAVLYVPNVGTAQQRTQQEQLDDVTKLDIRVTRCRVVSNNHNEADECEIWTSYDDAGIDPRFLRSAELYLYFGDADEIDGTTWGWNEKADNLRFVGIATDVERVFDESEGKNVRVRALDYTTLFLSCKQFPPEGIPKFTDTLSDAWRRICDHTGYFDLSTGKLVSTVQRLRDRIQFVGDGLESLTLGKATAERIRKLGKLQPTASKPDAWAVWQTAVGSLGLISYIRSDRCIVTTATDYYTADDPPKFVWGRNILKLTERRDVNALAKKNIHVISFNPLTMQALEAFWPPLRAIRPKGRSKKLGASALKGGLSVRAEDYEVFDCPMPISDVVVLENFAERVWEERTRQELVGTLTTREMWVDTLSGDSFDLLTLQAGDRIRVEIDRDGLTLIQRLSTISARVTALMELGYSSDMANFIAINLDSISKLTPEFQVHRVDVELDVSEAETGRYDMTINYLNRIEVSGSAQPGTGEGTPPITNQKKTTSSQTEARRNDRREKQGP